MAAQLERVLDLGELHLFAKDAPQHRGDIARIDRLAVPVCLLLWSGCLLGGLLNRSGRLLGGLLYWGRFLLGELLLRSERLLGGLLYWGRLSLSSLLRWGGLLLRWSRFLLSTLLRRNR